MARVRDIGSAELPAEARAVYERFVAGYGPFRDQVAVFAHCPPAVTHLMGLLLDLRASGTVRRRYLELAIVAVTNNPQSIGDALFARLRARFSEAEIVELTLRIALCGFFNRFNDALRI